MDKRSAEQKTDESQEIALLNVGDTYVIDSSVHAGHTVTVKQVEAKKRHPQGKVAGQWATVECECGDTWTFADEGQQ